MYLTIAKTAMPIERLLAANTNTVPIWEKHMLTIEEAAKYFNINTKKLRSMVDENVDDPRLVLMNGSKRLIKRENFARYLEDTRSI